MISTATRAPERFGVIAFGLIGFVYGVLQTAPWSHTEAAFLTGLPAKLAWSLVFAVSAALFGWRLGPRFVEAARTGHFARAAGLVIPALFLSAIVFGLLYFAVVVFSGDFGHSHGIFGSFVPTTLIQKLTGAVMLFVMQVLAMGISSIIVGFIAGYPLALLFDEEWKHEDA